MTFLVGIIGTSTIFGTVIIIVACVSLRGTKPHERAEILKALAPLFGLWSRRPRK